MSRWVRVQADILDHPLFANSERSESDAWLWLITNAAWSPTHHRIGNDVVPVPVGSVFVTLRGLAKEWNWKSEKRVRTFLRVLENHEMIVTKTDAGKTQVTICNYSKYQEGGRTQDAERTQDGRTKYTNTPNTSSLRSDVKAQAPAKPSVKSELMNVLDEDHSQAVIDHRKAIKKPMTVRAAQLLAAEFAKCSDPNEAADVMISAGWQGFKPEWLTNRKSSSRNEPPPKPSGSTNPRHQMWVEDLIEQNEPSHEPVSQAGNVYDLSHGEGYIRSDGGPDIRLAFASNGKW